MSDEWVMVPREPTAEQLVDGAYEVPDPISHRGELTARMVYRAMLDAAPTSPMQAEPVAWFDPTNKSPRQAVTFSKADRDEWPHIYSAALYTCPPAAPQQAETVAQIGWADEFGNLFPMGAWKPAQRTWRDSHKSAWRPVFLHPPAAEVQGLRAEVENLRADALRFAWFSDYGVCVDMFLDAPMRVLLWTHDGMFNAFTFAEAIDAARAAQGNKD